MCSAAIVFSNPSSKYTEPAIGLLKNAGKRSVLGFTLIELMIVVAVIGILAALSYPSYQESVAKGRRAQATAQLLAAQQWMERFFSENLSYEEDRDGNAIEGASGLFAARFNTVPPPGEGAAFYNLAIETEVGTYTITATRTGAFTTDRCGDLTVDHLGRKSFEGVSATTPTNAPTSTTGFASFNEALAYCWR